MGGLDTVDRIVDFLRHVRVVGQRLSTCNQRVVAVVFVIVICAARLVVVADVAGAGWSSLMLLVSCLLWL